MNAKRLLAALLGTALVLSLSTSCGSGGTAESDGGGTTDKLNTGAVEGALGMELWTFVELHGQFYEDMLKVWNQENPDKNIDMAMTVMPYDDMHNKLTMALQAGSGAPDVCDIEIGKFPNYLKGAVQLEDLTEYVEPYRADIVESRLEIYAKDGKQYGIPTHVGATVAFYNTEILETAGVDYRNIVTWDDYKREGEKVRDAGFIMGVSETNNTVIFDTMLNALGADKTDIDGNPTIDTPEALRALTFMKELNDAGIDQTIPGGHPDTEEGYGALNAGNYATVIRPLWMMSRYTNYMDDLEGKIAIAPAPIFEEGNKVSFGGGGTGTAITKECADIPLAAEWLCWAKLSELGNRQIWNVLGFDPVNMSLWNDEELTHNEENQFVQYFTTNPFDVLNSIKDDMGIIKATAGVPTVNDYLNNQLLPNVFESGADPAEELKSAQEQAETELAS